MVAADTVVESYVYDAGVCPPGVWRGNPVIYTGTAAGEGDGDWWDGYEGTSTTSAENMGSVPILVLEADT